MKLEEREKEAKRLKEFVEDYDDERDDHKYYKGRELQRRLGDRVREADLDAKDRNKEQEELEELRNKIFSGEYENPTQEYERAKKEHEKLYKPQILIDVNLENLQRKEREKERIREKLQSIESNRHILDVNSNDEGEMNALAKSYSIESISNEDANSRPNSASNIEIHYSRHGSESRDCISSVNAHAGNSTPSGSLQSLGNSRSQTTDATTTPTQAPVITLNLGANSKKKKIESTGVFNADEDVDDESSSKRRKLVPLDYDDNQTRSGGGSTSQTERHNSNAGKSISKKHGKNDTATTETVNNKKEENNTRIHDEKRRHIKSIIDRIPTQKEDLFNYKLDRNEIDNNLMERKIRPWINKKIIEYIGEPEPTLVDFICSKVLAGSSPQSILDDVQMVLDEEAEVFVVKMWRLLIYEVDAKKIGIGK
ncbi:PREDICTED: RNA-binding protein 25-like [Rhagoletis zephyria]|nr:PREDICTED: RNA-binding protein 25-like [Rhagoletis zephyria]